LLAALKGYVSVDDFSLWNSLYFFVMIVIGGMTSVLGGIVGAAIVTILPELLRGLQESAQAALGIVTLLIFLFMPGGVVTLVRRTYQATSATRLSSSREGLPD
jgi:branched-chain amino acid transport system permease protein